jgi:hypothetical protein
MIAAGLIRIVLKDSKISIYFKLRLSTALNSWFSLKGPFLKGYNSSLLGRDITRLVVLKSDYRSLAGNPASLYMPLKRDLYSYVMIYLTVWIIYQIDQDDIIIRDYIFYIK